ncbi:MAG: DUF5677 domain-containing protein [Candidatus Acidiferrales bacterium]
MGIKVEPNPDRSRRQNLPLQLETADKLLRFVETTTTEPQTPANLDPRRSCILMSLAAKTFATFQSVQALLKLGMHEDASALLRVMYESAMIATFLAHAADDQTVDDYADYFMFRNWRDHELAVQVNPEAAKAFPTVFLSKMKADFDAVRGRYDRNWTKLSAERMALAADTKLPSGFKVFTTLYASIYRQASAFVHSDVRSIQQFFEEDATGKVWIRRTSGPERCAEAMYAANFIMIAICWVVTASFYGKKFVPAWNALVLEWNGTPEALGTSASQ